jgi:hypothetical protein
MKMTLGGKLSIAVAVLIATSWLSLVFAGPDAYYVQIYGERAIFILSFPLGWLAGMFTGRHGGPPHQFYLYMALLIPNSFILGYSIAGLARLLRSGSNCSCPTA